MKCFKRVLKARIQAERVMQPIREVVGLHQAFEVGYDTHYR